MAIGGRPAKTDSRFEPIPFFIKNGDNEQVKRILSEIGIDAKDSYSRTALIWAAVHKNHALLSWLVNNQANVNQQDKSGYSALHFAAQERNEEAAEKLFDAGANPNLLDIHGNNPLWTAVFNAKGDLRMVKLYIQKGADLNNINKHQMSPKQLAETIAGLDLDKLP